MLIKQPGAMAMAVRTAIILTIFAIIFTSFLSGAYLITKPKLEAVAITEKQQLINEVLPLIHYNNDLLKDTLRLPPTHQLGLKESSTVYRARFDGKPAALVLEANAPDGYAGNIRLLIGILADGSLTGVRVTEHKETPGLGDYIDPKRDRNKTRPWISQFNGLSQQKRSNDGWRVKKDGGQFDAVTGATVTARAVIKAVHQAVQFVDEHKEQLFAETSEPS